MPYSLRISMIVNLGLCTALALLVAFRGATRDTLNYLDVFETLDGIPWSLKDFQAQYSMEWGYGFVAGLVKSAGLESNFLFFVISVLTFIPIAKASRGFGVGFLSVMPFYLPTFFLAQQLMQIRQGLAISLAFWSISIIYKLRPSVLLCLAIGAASILFHLVSLVPIFVAVVVRALFFRRNSDFGHSWIFVIFVATYFLCVSLMRMDLFLVAQRVSVYLADSEHGYTRSILDPANLRAIFLVSALFIWRPKPCCSMYRSYMFLLCLYCVHLAVRLGFMEVAILSGRVGSALGFAEVFLLPMLLEAQVKSRTFRIVICLLYFFVHLYIAFCLTFPFLLDDYFSSMA